MELTRYDDTLGFNITTDPDFSNRKYRIGQHLSHTLKKYHSLALKGKSSTVKKLKAEIERYPENPQLKNYLSVLYGEMGNYKKMFEVNRWIVAQHPDYLYGKVNLAFEFYQKKEFEKMTEVLGEQMDLKALYPSTDTFHLDEVIAFLKITALYYIGVDETERAREIHNKMILLEPEGQSTMQVAHQLMAVGFKKAAKRRQEEMEKKIVVNTGDQVTGTATEPPNFVHHEVQALYENGIDIDGELLNTILALPRETLIKDLRLVLKDSIDRYSYFYDGPYEEGSTDFAIHAFFILGEIQATESLDIIFEVLSQTSRYYDLYFDDFLTEAIWEPLYKLGNTELKALKEYIFTPGNYAHARALAFEVVSQIALHQPSRRAEVIDWFRDCAVFFLESDQEDNVIDSDLIAFMVHNVLDIGGKELLPEIEKLFLKEIVSEDFCGNFENVVRGFERPDRVNRIRPLMSMHERYAKIYQDWYSPVEPTENEPYDFQNDDFEDDFFLPETAVRQGPKVGRNDPCPCGSGKKHKKCCLNTSR